MPLPACPVRATIGSMADGAGPMGDGDVDATDDAAPETAASPTRQAAVTTRVRFLIIGSYVGVEAMAAARSPCIGRQRSGR